VPTKSVFLLDFYFLEGGLHNGSPSPFRCEPDINKQLQN